MKIVLCIKQVPDTADITWTENNTIQREGLESVINPFDTYAIETALRLKRQYKNVHITAITMGPPQAEEIIRKALALGVDNGFVVTDRKFAGADTIATGRTLSSAISEKASNPDLVICGQFATDGDTAQTGPTIANNLGYSQVTYVKEILSVDENSVKVKREVEDGIEIVEAKLPCVLCMLKCDYELSRPLINGFIVAQKAEVPFYSMTDVGLEAQNVGMKGSPTYVSKAFRPEQKKGGKKIVPETTKEAVDIIIENIYEQQSETVSVESGNA